MTAKDKDLTLVQEQKLKDLKEKLKDDTTAVNMGLDIARTLKADYDIEERLKRVAREIAPKNITKEKQTEEDLVLLSGVFYDMGLDNGASIVEAVEEKHRGMIFNLKTKLTKEFDCQNYSEKALIDVIVNAYARDLFYSKKLLSAASLGTTTANINNFMSIMSKEIDRANRIFISALETLKSFKQPELKVNIKTNTAFVGQNQKFNNNQNEINEIIKSE